MAREPEANSAAMSTTSMAGMGRPLARSGSAAAVQRGFLFTW